MSLLDYTLIISDYNNNIQYIYLSPKNEDRFMACLAYMSSRFLKDHIQTLLGLIQAHNVTLQKEETSTCENRSPDQRPFSKTTRYIVEFYSEYTWDNILHWLERYIVFNKT